MKNMPPMLMNYLFTFFFVKLQEATFPTVAEYVNYVNSPSLKQGQVRWNFEPPGVVESVPAIGRGVGNG